MTPSVLLIGDDARVAREFGPAFAREGYHLEHVLPGLDAIRKVLTKDPDLVILRISSQGRDWQFCQRLLTFLERPLLLLIATTNRLDRVKGLELGADDCMIEPILVVEVLARVRALLRRSESRPPRMKQSYFEDEGLVVDLSRREVWLNGEPVSLTPTEFRLLFCFTRHVGLVLSHEQLKMQVWGYDYPAARDAIKLYVHRLRRKLEPDPRRPRRILTRRGEGYMFTSLADR